MDAHSEKQANDPALTRIVSMLMALAALAEQASGRSLPVRCLVLWILRFAETAVLDMLADAMGMPDGLDPGPSFFRHGVSRHDCLRLAQSLRALAQAVADLPPLPPGAPLPPVVAALTAMLAAIDFGAGGSFDLPRPALAGRYPDTS